MTQLVARHFAHNGACSGTLAPDPSQEQAPVLFTHHASAHHASCTSIHLFRASYHLLACQVGEVGELSELFQWRADPVSRGLVGFSPEDKRRVGEEMSDVRS